MKKPDISDRNEQRKFGLVMAAAIIVLGLVRWALHGFHGVPWAFFAVAAVFAVLGLAAPGLLKPVFAAWMKFAEGVNWVMTRLMLGIVFYGMLAPTGLIMRMMGNDPLKQRRAAPDQSYWETPEPQPVTEEQFRQMF